MRTDGAGLRALAQASVAQGGGRCRGALSYGRRPLLPVSRMNPFPPEVMLPFQKSSSRAPALPADIWRIVLEFAGTLHRCGAPCRGLGLSGHNADILHAYECWACWDAMDRCVDCRAWSWEGVRTWAGRTTAYEFDEEVTVVLFGAAGRVWACTDRGAGWGGG